MDVATHNLDGYARQATEARSRRLPLGILYANGEGVANGLTKTAALFKQACTISEMSGCYDLGMMFANGIGVAKDATKAAAFFKEACQAGFQDAGK